MSANFSGNLLRTLDKDKGKGHGGGWGAGFDLFIQSVKRNFFCQGNALGQQPSTHLVTENFALGYCRA